MKILGIALVLAMSLISIGQVRAADPIKIADINSYSAMPAFTVPYRNGVTLALEQINDKGGVLGRPLVIISRDDNGRPDDALRAANELVFNEKVVALTGTFFSNVGLAVSDFAKKNKVLFVAPEALSDAITWQRGNRYTFRVRSSTYMQTAMLAERAAKLPIKQWAIVAPNYEFGHSAADDFKKLLLAKRPDVTFVAEQYPSLGKIDAGATIEALSASHPQGLFNATFGPDLVRFIREGDDRDFFSGLAVVSVLTGQPEFLDPLKDEAPVGWIVTGYPWDEIQTPDNRAFVDAYQKRFGDYPRAGSVSGYTTIKALAGAIEKAKSTDTEEMIDALEGLSAESPWGKVTFRKIDHQSSMGMFVGKIAVKNDKGTMTDFAYEDGANYLPSDQEVRRMRPLD